MIPKKPIANSNRIKFTDKEPILYPAFSKNNALIVQHRNLRILHGKGNGILRQLVRQYLATVDVVKSFRDEHVEFGGSGITVVVMDF